ncbi:Tfp pilus assembly protein PilN [Motilibacter peucedani]|uniref:Tfp pilus assembly protein PilN n=1 Tax=Motilibacter peucedani TaxID=598650 RepID=A0A420XSF4_9ACTN|nr:PilN domain-containing protein [Motilibacter peucedani]RKS77760.1 Tfp pilus assembly protein PilN [Motilibacter peucedani]
MSTVVLSKERAPQTLDRARVATFPRVDLLPPEIQQAQAFRRAQGGMAAVLVAAVALVAAGYVTSSHGVSSAQEQLDAEQARSTALLAQQAKYAQVPKTYEARDTARQQLATAMGSEVRWSHLLSDLATTTPAHVWLTDVRVSQSVDVPAPTDASVIGSITFAGQALSTDDVATWLDTLRATPGFTGELLSSTTAGQTSAGGRPVYAFTTTVSVTAEMLSHRYDREKS